MNPKIKELLERIRQLEDEIESEIERRRAELHIDFENKRIRFERSAGAAAPLQDGAAEIF